MAESLVLSDGTRSYDFLDAAALIFVDAGGISLPVVTDENAYAETPDSDGRTRIRTRALNSESGSLALNLRGTSSDLFWDAVDNLQELVLSAHRNKGTLTYTKFGSTNAVTFDLEAINVTGLPIRGTAIAQRHAEAAVSFETKPYGRLPQVVLSTATNLAVNGTFETNTTGWSTATATLTRVTDMFRTGVASGHVAVASGATRGIVATSNVTVSASTAYTAGGWVKACSSSDVGLQIKIRLEELTSLSVNVGETESTVTLTNEWQYVSVARLMGATGVRAKVHFLNVTSGAVEWVVDDITLALSQVLVGPIDYFAVESVPGQVDAWGALTVTDISSYSRNHIEVGVQHNFDSANPELLLLRAVNELSALGGSSNTRAGSYSTNIIRAALTTSPVAVCTSGSQPHKGPWKIRARVYPSTTDVRVRVAWRAGDGPFTAEKWVSVPNSAGWYDLDLGTVKIGELPSGHTAEFRIEAFTTTGVPTVDVDILTLIPCDNYTRLRGSIGSETPVGGVVAVDDFSTQTAGAVTGKTPLLAPAGNWSGAGDADDFQVDTSLQDIYRTAVSDSTGVNGRYLRCGSGTLAATHVNCDVFVHPSTVGADDRRQGVFLRYSATTDWLMAFVQDGVMWLTKRVAGVESIIGDAYFSYTNQWISLLVGADTSGNAMVWACPRYGTLVPLILVLGDSSLASAGALASGGYGIYDAWEGATAATRRYDNFSVKTSASSSASIINPAINGGHALSLLHNTSLSDNADGDAIGTTPVREGRYLTMPPATRNGDAPVCFPDLPLDLHEVFAHFLLAGGNAPKFLEDLTRIFGTHCPTRSVTAAS